MYYGNIWIILKWINKYEIPNFGLNTNLINLGVVLSLLDLKSCNQCLKDYFCYLKDFLNDFKKIKNEILMEMFLGTPSHNNIMQHL
jgi:hypothetical protein